MPLIIAPENRDSTITRVAADEKTKMYLASLGITPNAVVRLLNSTNGSVIVLVKDTRLALDRKIASKIFVC